MEQETRNRARSALVAIATLWVGSIAAGSWLMLQHAFGQGDSAPAPHRLSSELADSVAFRQRPLTLVVAVHPNCPCTGATLEQLDRFLTRHPQSAQVVALFWVEDEETNPAALETNRYWKRVSKMEAANAAIDPQGKRAAQFGALVSGAVAAYDRSGVLRFQGGLTPSRGHDGPSRGLDILESIARGEPVGDTKTTPSFGCSLAEALES